MAGSTNISRPASAGPSRPRTASPSTPSYQPSSFTPLPRSLLSGANVRFSPTPPPEGESPQLPADHDMSRDTATKSTDMGAMGTGTALRGDIFIDEIPRKSTPPLPDTVNEESNGHFDPPGLFSTAMMPTLSSTSNGVVVELRTSPEIHQAQTPSRGDKGKGKGKAQLQHDQTEAEDGLLLPSHVLVDSMTPSRKDETDGDNGATGEDLDEDDPMQGVHFVDDEISRGSKRYFDLDQEPKEVEATFLSTADQSKICQNCKRPGHRSKDCKHVICTTCGAEDAHERRDCPVGLVCYGCGNRGHRKQDCPDPTTRMSRRTGCDRCGSRDHLENTCHTIWRVYAHRSTEARSEVQREKHQAEGWEKEAVGGGPADEWCYNCAKEGHFGDDCQKRRGSLARLTVPSAFSASMSSRGPFFLSRPRAMRNDLPPPTHSRFDDDDGQDDYDSLPFVSGYGKFAGSNAGRKSREKEKEKHRQMALAEDDDEPSWFDGAGRGGLNIRGRGRGGRGGFSTPTSGRGNANGNGSGNRSGGPGRKPWDSEYRERTPRNLRDRDRSRSPASRGRNGRQKDRDDMPFSHGHLMSPSAPAPSSAPAKVISFGKLSAPGSHSSDSPAVKGAKSLLNRALGNAAAANLALANVGTPTGRGKRGATNKDGASGSGSASPLVGTPRSGPVSERDTPSGFGSKRRKRNRGDGEGESERDWESEWRGSGQGGGKVESWGREMGMDNDDRPGALNSANGGIKIRGRGVGGGQPVNSGSEGGNGKNRGKSKGKNKGKGNDDGTGNAGAGAGAGGKGRKNSGQKYHGGYM